MSGFKHHEDGGRILPNAKKFYYGKFLTTEFKQVPKSGTSPADIKKSMMGFPDKRTVMQNNIMSEQEYLFISDIYKAIKGPTHRGLNVSPLIKNDKYIMPIYAWFSKIFVDSLNHALENRETFGHDTDFIKNWSHYYREQFKMLSNEKAATDNLVEILKDWGRI